MAESKGIIAGVAPAAAHVAAHAGYVKINTDKIHDYCKMIVSKYSVTTDLGADDHFVSPDREKAAAYVLALDSINFGSGYFHIAKERRAELEYRVIAGGLKKFFNEGTFDTPQKWLEIASGDFAHILAIPRLTDPALDDLMAAMAHSLRDVGKRIVDDYRGKVMNLVEASGFSALKLADIAAGWTSFRDVHAYKGHNVPIYKRAQILASDMNLALKGFTDLDKLTIFADNMVPHVLRCDGILTYNYDLATRVDQGVYIQSGSEEEIEIRASAIHVVELMKKAAGNALTAVNLDHMLWHRGYEPEIYKRPSHRTLTTNY